MLGMVRNKIGKGAWDQLYGFRLLDIGEPLKIWALGGNYIYASLSVR